MNKNFLIVTIIIAIIAVGASGFILGKYYSDISKEATEVYESGPDESKIAEKETGKCAPIQGISEKNQCWVSLAKEEKDENYCKKISADFPEARGDCYTELAILKDDSLICEKIISGSLHKSCLEYFEENDEKDETADWKTYQNKKYGFELKHPEYLEIQEKDDINFNLYLGAKVFMSILDSGMEGQIRLYEIKGSEKKVLVDGLEGLHFLVENMKDDSDALIHQTLVKKDNKLYLFVGEGEIFEKILSTFKFINPVVDYFENAELQCETEIRKQEIFTALNDVLNLSEEQLKQRRYKDYTGKENQWDLPTLIYRHFIPEYPGVTLGNNFYHDVKSVEAQKQIKQILEKYF